MKSDRLILVKMWYVKKQDFDIFAKETHLVSMKKVHIVFTLILLFQGFFLGAQENAANKIELSQQEKEAMFFQKLCFSQTIFPIYEDIFGLDAEPISWITIYWPENKFGFLESKTITISNEHGGEIVFSDDQQHSVSIRGSLMGNSQAIDDKGNWLNFKRNFVGKITIDGEEGQKSSISKNLSNKTKITTHSGQQITIKNTRIGLEISDNRGNNALIEIDSWGNRTLYYPNEDYIAFEYIDAGYQISSNFINDIYIKADSDIANLEVQEGSNPPYRIINKFQKPLPPDDASDF